MSTMAFILICPSAIGVTHLFFVLLYLFPVAQNNCILYICNVILLPVFFNGVFINFGQKQSVDSLLFTIGFNGPTEYL